MIYYKKGADMAKTLKEASEYLGKSTKTISRYIQKGLLNPDRLQSAQGTLEYSFDDKELEAFREKLNEKTGQTERQDRQEGQKTDRIEAFLLEQIRHKDRQIDRLTSLLALTQNKILQIEAPKQDKGSKRLALLLASLLLIITIGLLVYNLLPILRGLLK